MRKLLITLCFIAITGLLFAQSNVKVVEYKVLTFEKKVDNEYVVPKGETWRIENAIGNCDDKLLFFMNDKEYILYYSLKNGITDGFLPFYLPENTKFNLNISGENISFIIAVLKIE